MSEFEDGYRAGLEAAARKVEQGLQIAQANEAFVPSEVVAKKARTAALSRAVENIRALPVPEAVESADEAERAKSVRLPDHPTVKFLEEAFNEGLMCGSRPHPECLAKAQSKWRRVVRAIMKFQGQES